jgi:hypothetical protein
MRKKDRFLIRNIEKEKAASVRRRPWWLICLLKKIFIVKMADRHPRPGRYSDRQAEHIAAQQARQLQYSSVH